MPETAQLSISYHSRDGTEAKRGNGLVRRKGPLYCAGSMALATADMLHDCLKVQDIPANSAAAC